MSAKREVLQQQIIGFVRLSERMAVVEMKQTVWIWHTNRVYRPLTFTFNEMKQKKALNYKQNCHQIKYSEVQWNNVHVESPPRYIFLRGKWRMAIWQLWPSWNAAFQFVQLLSSFRSGGGGQRKKKKYPRQSTWLLEIISQQNSMNSSRRDCFGSADWRDEALG